VISPPIQAVVLIQELPLRIGLTIGGRSGGCPIRIRYNPTEDVFFANQQDSEPIFALYPYPSETFLNPNDDQEGDGYRDYWLLSNWDSQSYGRITCLNPEEMGFYHGGAMRVINWYLTNQSAGRDFISCAMWADVLLSPSQTGNTQHAVEITVGDYVP